MMGGSSNDGEVIVGSTSNHGEVITQQRKERLCSLTWKQQNVFIFNVLAELSFEKPTENKMNNQSWDLATTIIRLYKLPRQFYSGCFEV